MKQPDASMEKPLASLDATVLRDVQVVLETRLGRATMSVDALMALKAGAVVPLDVAVGGVAELLLNDVAIARGERAAWARHDDGAAIDPVAPDQGADVRLD